jgi:hypothetical protein
MAFLFTHYSCCCCALFPNRTPIPPPSDIVPRSNTTEMSSG